MTAPPVLLPPRRGSECPQVPRRTPRRSRPGRPPLRRARRRWLGRAVPCSYVLREGGGGGGRVGFAGAQVGQGLDGPVLRVLLPVVVVGGVLRRVERAEP